MEPRPTYDPQDHGPMALTVCGLYGDVEWLATERRIVSPEDDDESEGEDSEGHLD